MGASGSKKWTYLWSSRVSWA